MKNKNMTPAVEKANDLIDDYYNMLMDNIDDEFIRRLVAIRCALKAVDEIINTLTNSWCVISDKENWDEVKQQLENSY